MVNWKTFEQTGTHGQRRHFTKLCQLCSPNFTKEDILSSEFDWDLIWQLALRHRVVPVMADRIKQLGITPPDDMAMLIKQNVQQNLYKGLTQAAELVHLTTLFQEKNVRFLVFKGIALLKLFGLELHQRHNGDIDILLETESDLWRVDEYLRESGYVRTHPEEASKFDKNTQQYWLLTRKDFVYWHPKKRIELEVHTRLCVNNASFPVHTEGFFRRQSEIQISSANIPVMSKDDYFYYLLVHGSFSYWSRLKWLFDIALVDDDGKGCQSLGLLNDARNLGIERMVAQGLKLANLLLLVPISNDVNTYLERDKKARRIIDYAFVSLLGREPGELNKNRSYTRYLKRILSYELLLRDDSRYKLRQLRWYLAVFSKR